MVAGVAAGITKADAGFADEDDIRARIAAGSDDGRDVGAGFLFGQALQEVVAADADDDEAGYVPAAVAAGGLRHRRWCRRFVRR